MPRTSLGLDWSLNRVKPVAHRLPRQWPAIDACPPGSDAGPPSAADASAPPPPGAADAGPPPAAGDDSGAGVGDAAATGGDAGQSDGGTADAGSPSFDWNFAVAGPVNAAAAMVIPNFPASSPSDAIFFGAKSGSPNFYELTSIYATSPTIGWQATTGGLDGSAITLSADGTKAFAVDRTGAVYCFAAASGAVCSGWSSQSTSFGRPVSWSSPWIDYGTGALYFADLGGYLDKLNTVNGQAVWSFKLSTTSIHSSPVEESGYVYLRDDGGSIYRVLDPGSAAPTAADVSSYSICAPSCTASALVNGPTIDLSTSTAYFVGGGAIEEFALGSGTWAPTATLSLNMPTATDESSPILDGAGQLYVGFANAVFRASYPLSSAKPPVVHEDPKGIASTSILPAAAAKGTVAVAVLYPGAPATIACGPGSIGTDAPKASRPKGSPSIEICVPGGAAAFTWTARFEI